MRKTAEIVLEEIGTRFPDRQQILIAIDGRCAAGKTTLAGQLQTMCGCNVIHMDQFFLRPEQRNEARLAEPGGNVDYERVLTEVMIPLKKGEAFSYRPYSCSEQRLVEAVSVQPNKITIIEGSYSCHPTLVSYYDFKVFLTVGKEEQMRRIEKRNGTEKAEMFRNKWIPLEEAYFAAYPVKEQCDLTF